MLLILLMAGLFAKIVVVDDLGITGKQSQPVAKKILDALENTAKNTDEEVVLSNGTNSKRILPTNKNNIGLDGINNSNLNQDYRRYLSNSSGCCYRYEPGCSEERMCGIEKSTANFMSNNYTPVDYNHQSPNYDILNQRIPYHLRYSKKKTDHNEEYPMESDINTKYLDNQSRKNPSYGTKPAYDFNIGAPLKIPKKQDDKYVPAMISEAYKRSSNYMDLNPNESDLMKKEKENMTDASRARRNYIDLKISQTKKKEEEIQMAIDKSTQNLEQTSERIQETERQKQAVISMLHTKRNHIKNLEVNKKEVEIQKARTTSLVRLARNELLKLSKIIDDKKSKLSVLEDEERVYSERIKKYDDEHDGEARDLQFGEARLEDINKDIDELSRIQNVFKSRNGDYMNQKNREIAMRNKLELEKERLERNDLDFV